MKKQNLLKSMFIAVVMLFGTGAFAQTQVANIAAFNALPDNTIATITGEVTVTHDQGSNLFVQDETGWLMMYESGRQASCNSGDKITGLTGEFLTYEYDRGFVESVQPEMMSSQVYDAITPGVAPAAPFVVNPSTLTFNDYNRYVAFENVEIESDVAYNSAAAVDGVILTDAGTMKIRNHWYYNTTLNINDKSFAAGDKVNCKGIVRSYGGIIQIYLTDIELAEELGINDITTDGCQITGYFNLLGQKLNDVPEKGVYIETYSNCPPQKMVK